MGDILEAHFARDDLEATQFGLSLQRLKPDQRLPFGHQHEEQEEVYVIVGGSGRLKVGDEVLEVGKWDAVRVVARADPRRSRPGPTGSSIIAFGAPNTGLQDAKQEMGWWSETD